MPMNPPENMTRVTPNIFYDDVESALEFLSKTFGFETRMSIPGSDDQIIHAEMQIQDGVIMMSPAADNESWASPQSQSGRVTQSLFVYVDDVDEHCSKARSTGAEIVSELEDMFWGDRTYVATDLEGHRWTFAQRTKDVDLTDMPLPS